MAVEVFRCVHDPYELELVFTRENATKLDVLIMEQACPAGEEFQWMLNEVARGNMTPEDMMHRAFFIPFEIPFYEKMLETIHNTGIEIVLEESPISLEETTRLIELCCKVPNLFSKGEVEECVKLIKSGYTTLALTQRRREESLVALIQRAVEKWPKVGVLYGSAHSYFIWQCQKRGIKIHSHLPYSIYEFPTGIEILRELIFDKITPDEIDTLRYLRALVESAICGVLYSVMFPLQVAYRVSKKVARKFSEEEIKDIAGLMNVFSSYSPFLLARPLFYTLHELGYDVLEIALEEREKLFREITKKLSRKSRKTKVLNTSE